MQINLNFSNLYLVVERTLSIVGKRSIDDKGNRIFTDITLGTNEKAIIEDYFQQAVIDLSAETKAFITGSSNLGSSTPSITLTFPTNHNSQLETFLQKACDAYCVSFALHCWMTIVAPRIAERYLEDCKRQADAVTRLLYEKTPPVSSATFTNTTGSVTEGSEQPQEPADTEPADTEP